MITPCLCRVAHRVYLSVAITVADVALQQSASEDKGSFDDSNSQIAIYSPL